MMLSGKVCASGFTSQLLENAIGCEARMIGFQTSWASRVTAVTPGRVHQGSLGQKGDDSMSGGQLRQGWGGSSGGGGSAGAGMSNWAVVDVGPVTCTLQFPVPLQAPLQPVNTEPGAGKATSITIAPLE